MLVDRMKAQQPMDIMADARATVERVDGIRVEAAQLLMELASVAKVYGNALEVKELNGGGGYHREMLDPEDIVYALRRVEALAASVLALHDDMDGTANGFLRKMREES